MINSITKEQSLNTIEKNIIGELPEKKLWGDLDITYEEFEILGEKLKSILAEKGEK